MRHRPRLFVTLEGYAVEGGLDGPYQPATCYRPTIALGRHEGPGAADDLWTDYERVLELVPGLGVDGVRLSLEWARIEPRRGEVDEAALERYAAVARHAQSLGLDVTIALVDAAWPAWLGLEAWLLPWVVPHVVEHATRVVRHLGDVVDGVIAFTSPGDLVQKGYLDGSAPPWRRRAKVDADFAHAQIRSIVKALRDDVEVGPKVVATFDTISLDASSERLAAAGGALVDQLFVRSLVRGSGPTSAPVGLLAQRDGAWRVESSAGLLDALR